MSASSQRRQSQQNPVMIVGIIGAAATILAAVIGAVIGGLFILYASNHPSAANPVAKAGPSHYLASGTPTPSTSGQPTPGMVSFGALQKGDCITGSDLNLASSSSPWPNLIKLVPCSRPHLGEVIYSHDYWSATETYPGTKAVDNRGLGKCKAVFRTYVGTIYDYSKFSLSWAAPDTSADWRSGDRYLLCVAYDPAGAFRGTVQGSRR